MKTLRFTGSRVIGVLKQAEAGTPVPGLCREHGSSSATFYDRRKSLFGTSGEAISAAWTPRCCPNARRRVENRRLKKMYAEAQLSADLSKEALSRNW